MRVRGKLLLIIMRWRVSVSLCEVRECECVGMVYKRGKIKPENPNRLAMCRL